MNSSFLTKLFCSVGLAVCFSLTVSQYVNAQYPVAIGDEHTDFDFPDIENGEAVKLSEFRGKKLLLVHFASW